MRRSLTIAEDTDIGQLLAKFDEACRSRGLDDADRERVVEAVTQAVNEYAERGRDLLRHGSNLSMKRVIEEPPARIELHFDFRAGQRPLWDRLRRRLLGA